MLRLADSPFDARKTVLCSISRRAMTKIEGAWYSVPSRWKGLSATAHVGCTEVTIRCGDEIIEHARQSFGGRCVDYRHYIDELSRKPQALRQVVPELLAELSEPYRELWRLLVDRHGPADAARSFARILGAVSLHGEELVGEAISRAIDAGRTELIPLPSPQPTSIDVPERLRSYRVEQASAGQFDLLMTQEAPHV